jgi:hypothetical protein
MAASMKIRAFWGVSPCSLGVDRRFRGAYCPDDGGGTHLSNVGIFQQDYATLRPRRL